MPPQVSIIIPTRNRPALVRRAVHTVLNQTLTDWELIVIDDGSEIPVTPELLRTNDPRVTVLRREGGTGVSATRNAGIAQATGAWVAFLDDDDYWAREKLEIQLGHAAISGSGFVYTAVILVDEDGRYVYERGIGPDPDMTRALLSHNAVGEPSSVVVRRDILDAAGPFSDRLSMLADWDMWLRLTALTRPFGVRRHLTVIMLHPGNMQVVDIHRAEDELDILRELHADTIARNGGRLGSVWIDLWLAEKRRRAEPSWQTSTAYARTVLRAYGPARTARRGVMRAYGKVRGRRRPPPWARQPTP